MNWHLSLEKWSDNNMVAIYVRRIKAGLMTLEQVPERWREAVREIIEQ